jgi:chemotaxis protein CheX
MESPVDIATYAPLLGDIVRHVFQTMMCLDVTDRDGAEPPPTAGTSYTAAIYLTGLWNGAVMFDCGGVEAAEWTGRLLGIAAAECTRDDIHDALGELANMIGGNLKSSLPHGEGLSMPSVVAGRDYALRVCGAAVLLERAFTTEVGGFRVSLLQMNQGEARP